MSGHNNFNKTYFHRVEFPSAACRRLYSCVIIAFANGVYSEQQVLLAIAVLVQSSSGFLVCFSILDLLCKSCLFHETTFLFLKHTEFIKVVDVQTVKFGLVGMDCNEV